MDNKKNLVESTFKDTSKYSIRRIFLKQALLRSTLVNASSDFSPKQTDTKIRINIGNTQIDDAKYEVSLEVQALIDSHKAEQSSFELSFNQSGIFSFRSTESPELQPLLYIDCPEALFPYARELMDSMMLKAGLQPLSMVMPDFRQLYNEMQNKQKRTFEPELWGGKDPNKKPITH